MTAPPDARETPDGRFYVLQEGTPQEERLRSVTAALGRWDKDGLVPWSAGLAAKAAFEDLPRLVASLMLPECGRTYNTCKDHDWRVKCELCRCEKCSPCMIRYMRDRHMAETHRRSDEGTRVHHTVTHWTQTGFWPMVDPDIQVYIDALQRFVAEYGLRPEDWEMTEATVLNREYGYAGTLDAIVHIYRDRSQASADLLDRLTPDGAERLTHALGMVDYKSREKPEREVFLDMPLQLAGYRYAQVIRLVDGTELPMIPVDFAAIVQVRPDMAQVCLVLAEEPEFAAFLNLLGADQWALERGKKAIGARTFSYAPSVAKARATDARRRAAAAKKEAAGQPQAAGPAVAPPVASGAPGTGSAQERGARAAQAATATSRGAADDRWVQLARTHGARVKADAQPPAVTAPPAPAAATRPAAAKPATRAARRPVLTTEASVLGAAGGPQSEEPPF